MEIIEVDVEKIIPYENNPRNNENAVDAVVNSIQEFGFRAPVLLDKDMVLIAGHTRLLAAKQLGMKMVPAIMVEDLTDEQVRAYRLADNKTTELAGWNEELLSEELAGILDIDMSLFGFDGEDSKLGEDLLHDKYSMAVNVPQYEITGDCPTFDQMLDTEKADELIEEIEQSNVTDEEKKFLIQAAGRHNVFNYRNIAEYYAHAEPAMQRLMEKSALVIIDVDDAIANGYANLMSDIVGIMEEQQD